MSKESWFVDWAKRRMGSQRNFLLAIVGETGSGKSYMGMRMGEVLDINGDFWSDHVVFTPEGFFDCLSKLKNNCFVMFDEAGVSFSHRKFMSMVNQMLGFVFQTFRYKFINVIFTIPSLGYMDYVGRGLLHAVIRMLDRGYGAVYRVQKDMLGRRIFYPKIGFLRSGLPNEELIKAYEEKKAGIMDKRYEDWGVELESVKQRAGWRFSSVIEISKEILKHKEDFLNDKGKFDAFLISGQLGIGVTKSYVVKRYLEKVHQNHAEV